MGVVISQYSVSISLGYIPEVELLDDILVLVFWGSSTLFPTVTEPIYIAANTVQGCLHLYVLANACFLHTHSDPWEVVLICLYLIVTFSIGMHLLAILMSFWKTVNLVLFSFKNVIVFMVIELYGFSIYVFLDINPLSNIQFTKISPILPKVVFFILLIASFLVQNFWIWYSPMCWFLLLLFVLSVSYSKKSCCQDQRASFLRFLLGALLYFLNKKFSEHFKLSTPASNEGRMTRGK